MTKTEKVKREVFYYWDSLIVGVKKWKERRYRK